MSFQDNTNERAPLMSWSQWYAIVIASLLLCVLLFYLFTQHFS